MSVLELYVITFEKYPEKTTPYVTNGRIPIVYRSTEPNRFNETLLSIDHFEETIYYQNSEFFILDEKLVKFVVDGEFIIERFSEDNQRSRIVDSHNNEFVLFVGFGDGEFNRSFSISNVKNSFTVRLCMAESLSITPPDV